MKYGVIDIGSNSVRLLLWEDGCSIYKKLNTTRLGKGIEQSGRLTADAIDRTVRAVGEFEAQAMADGAQEVFAFATAAVRKAANGAEFTAKLFSRYGIQTDVISGEEEARIGFLGALGGRDGGIIDVGGASSEVTIGKNGKIIYAVSADIGAVRLLDMCRDDISLMDSFVRERIAVYGAVPFEGNMCAIGGTATSLVSIQKEMEVYDPAEVDGSVLFLGDVYDLADRLLGMTAEERRALKGMDPNRTDVIGGGAFLLGRIMEYVGADCVTVSEKDNQEGYIISRLTGEGL